jgi:Zn-dependent peptidase ImmA (M78 family)
MNSAQQRAQEIRRRYHFTGPQDIERVLKAENVYVRRIPFVGRIDEMIVYNYIGIRSSLRDSRRVRELLAHALGHHLLHSGNQPYYYFRGDHALTQQWERQAWDFAYELLMPAQKLEELLRQQSGDDDVRDYFQVSEEFYRERKEAFREGWMARGVGDVSAHNDTES